MASRQDFDWQVHINQTSKQIPASNYLFYLDEQCVKAFRALERSNSYLNFLTRRCFKYQEERNNCFYDFFDDLSRFCLEAALVSKTLWPVHAKTTGNDNIRKRRGKEL